MTHKVTSSAMHPSLHLKMKIFILADSSKMNQSMSECSLNFRTQLAGLHLDWTLI